LSKKQPFYGFKRTNYSGVSAKGLWVPQALPVGADLLQLIFVFQMLHAFQ
jgi:hypothetical protein